MKILLVQTSFLGDTILSTPVISGIKTLHPDAELWMMTTPLAAQLVERDPLLAGVIPFDKRGEASGVSGLMAMAKRLRAMGFRKAYALQRSFRTGALLWLAGIPERIGFANARLSFLFHRTGRRNPSDHDVIRNLSILAPEIPLSELDQEMRLFAPDRKELSEAVEKVLPEPGTYAVLVPGSAWPTKMWSSERFAEVALWLSERGLDVVLLGAPQDRPASDVVKRKVPSAIDLTGKSSISETLHVTANARLVVCNDSMALHMASAFKVPNVAVFCATTPEFGFTPWKNRAEVVEKEGLACKPCSRHGQKRCPEGTEACMRDLPASAVTDAIRRLVEL